MSGDEADPELLELLRKSLGLQSGPPPVPETGVLESARFICDNSIDVALDMYGTQSAAEWIYSEMQLQKYSTSTWAEHELHPTREDMGEEELLNFVFTMDLLNFSFWSEKGEDERFAVHYRGKRWTGYWSLVAALRRALDDGVQITSPHFWHDDEDLTVSTLVRVFRCDSEEEMPMLAQRFSVLKEAGEALCKVNSHPNPTFLALTLQNFDSSVIQLVQSAGQSAAKLVNLLAEHFPSFKDETRFEGRRVRLLKRAQIFVADTWAAFEGQGPGTFADIDKITMFADYRIPQILHSLGCMSYSPPLEAHIRAKSEIPSGSSWEVQLRGCSIWCVETLRKQILRKHPDAKVNAILIDFFLYDAMKRMESAALSPTGESIGDADGESVTKEEQRQDMIPHHRTRSIWY